MSDSYGSIMKQGLWDNNVVFSQLLAMCPTMAVTTSGTNGLGMGLATTAVLVVSNILVSMIRHTVSSQVRIPVFVVLIATLVTIVDMAMNAWLHDLYKVLGLFIALIVVNCAILGRAEAFAVKNGVVASAVDGLAMGLGFTGALDLHRPDPRIPRFGHAVRTGLQPARAVLRFPRNETAGLRRCVADDPAARRLRHPRLPARRQAGHGEAHG